MSASLQIDRVEVSFGQVKVLKGVSLDVKPGEFVALLGSSGCGKTTLLRSISGFVAVEKGAIRVDAADVTRLPPERRNMAMVFQSYALWPHMTAAQNIGYGLKLRRVPKADARARVDEVLAMLKLEGLGGRMVGQLSGGQRQRVALGRALAINPRILLLDEPLSNLDARIREDVRHEIKALQKSLGITAIHVTHDREEAMVMADRIVILDAGTIAQQGAPEEIYNRPASPFVAAFLGAANAIRLTAHPEAGATRIEAGPFNATARVAGADGLAGAVVAHFRSEAAELVEPGADCGDDLVLRGQVRQVSYPGGFWRYAVAVGEQEFMVDDERRREPGAPVGIRLASSAVHLFPDRR